MFFKRINLLLPLSPTRIFGYDSWLLLLIMQDIDPMNSQKKNEPTVVMNIISDKNIPEAAMHKADIAIELKNGSETKNLFFI